MMVGCGGNAGYLRSFAFSNRLGATRWASAVLRFRISVGRFAFERERREFLRRRSI
jgi:hypothetical protein